MKITIFLIFMLFLAMAHAQSNRPDWIQSPPKDDEFVYSVGEARDIENKDDALERAWISALLRIGMAQFPELGTLKSESEETLESANYSRKFVMEMERINWAGVKEVEEKGSPYIVEDTEKGTFSVYRLIKWKKSDLQKAKTSISKKKNKIPVSPEIERKTEDDLIDQVKEINKVADRIQHRDNNVQKVLSRVKCGTTIADIRRILGEPDRKKDGCYYFWGTYEVFSCDGIIFSITPNNGHSGLRTVCR